MFEATGYSPLVFEAMECLGKNGVLILASVTGGNRSIPVPADLINLGFVLGNKVVVGTVNANREYFEAGVYDLAGRNWNSPAGCRSYSPRSGVWPRELRYDDVAAHDRERRHQGLRQRSPWISEPVSSPSKGGRGER